MQGGQDKELGITTLARSGFIKQLICIYEYAMLPSASTKHRAVQALTEMLPLEKTATLSCGEKNSKSGLIVHLVLHAMQRESMNWAYLSLL